MKSLVSACQKLRWAQTWRWLLAVTVAAIAGLAFGRNVLGTVCVVNGPSMVPTYAPGSSLITYPVMDLLKRSDVVILDDGSEKYAVKRVVGLPGETVQIWRGHVFVNHRMLVEPYLPKHTYTCPVEGHKVSETMVLKDGQYLVLGDNRACSTDSRVYGPVDEDQIKLRVPLGENFPRASLGETVVPANYSIFQAGVAK